MFRRGMRVYLGCCRCCRIALSNRPLDKLLERVWHEGSRRPVWPGPALLLRGSTRPFSLSRNTYIQHKPNRSTKLRYTEKIRTTKPTKNHTENPPSNILSPNPTYPPHPNLSKLLHPKNPQTPRLVPGTKNLSIFPTINGPCGEPMGVVES